LALHQAPADGAAERLLRAIRAAVDGFIVSGASMAPQVAGVVLCPSAGHRQCALVAAERRGALATLQGQRRRLAHTPVLPSLVTVLELDHVFFIVTDPAEAVRRLEDDGWVLDAGQAHRGQGTRNRRLVWREQFFELVWVTDAAEARANRVRLDRRADWTTTGTSPIGLAFRGQVDPAHNDEFWLYDALGPRIWIHRDNERFPQRPLVFVLEAAEEEIEQRRRRVSMSGTVARRPRGELREIRVRGPSRPSLPHFAGPPIVYLKGPHLLELVVDDERRVRPISDGLIIRG
jgi:hypothetical protein